MNDTVQKTMTNATTEAKAQFDAASKVFESYIGNDGAKKAAEQSAETLRAARHDGGLAL